MRLDVQERRFSRLNLSAFASIRFQCCVRTQLTIALAISRCRDVRSSAAGDARIAIFGLDRFGRPRAGQPRDWFATRKQRRVAD